jgi:hypothetical protein
MTEVVKKVDLRCLVVGADLEDSIGIDLEGDVDLEDATLHRGDTGDLELAEEVVVLGQ